MTFPNLEPPADAERIAATNDAAYRRYVRKLFDQPASATRYVIKRQADGLYYAAPRRGALGTVWVGSPDHAEHFEFMTIAHATILFELDEAPEVFEVVPAVEQ